MSVIIILKENIIVAMIELEDLVRVKYAKAFFSHMYIPNTMSL